MEQRVTNRYLNLPNLLTFTRIGAVPLLMVLVGLPGKFAALASVVVFGLAALTDFFDGYLARRYNDVTHLGKLLDPLADKIIIITPLIMLIAQDRVPAWAVVIIVVRELAITGLRSVAALQNMIIDASAWGKYKTFAQSLAVVFLLLHYSYGPVNFHQLGTATLYAALVLTIWSGIDYLYRCLRTLTETK